MKTTIDISEKSLAEAMRFAGAKTKREAIITAVEEYNRRKRVEQFLQTAKGGIPDFPEIEEIRGTDSDRQALLDKLWNE